MLAFTIGLREGHKVYIFNDEIVARLEVLDGQCVRLVQTGRNERTLYQGRQAIVGRIKVGYVRVRLKHVLLFNTSENYSVLREEFITPEQRKILEERLQDGH